MKNKKFLKVIGILFLIILVSVLLIIFYKNKKYVSILKSDIGDNILKVSTNYNSIYDEKYQSKIDKKINSLLEMNSYSFYSPLLIYNPYGTNTLSLNIYFTTSENASLTYKIEAEGTSTFERTLYNGEKDNLTKNHKYQIVGLVPNKENKITLTLTYENGETETNEITVNCPSLNRKNDFQITNKNGESEEQLENGLFTVLGHDKNFNANIYMFDNDGYIRSEIVLDDYRADRILFIDGNMLYSNDKDTIVAVDRLGHVVDKYVLDGYTMHHDYIYDENNNNLLVLVNQNGSDTMEDIVISVDLDTKEVSKLLDMKDYFSEALENAEMPENGKNSYGGDELDWIHINSISLNDNSLYLSSRELSTIIKIDDLYGMQELDYIISDPSVWEGTSLENKLLTKKGDFVSQAGQHAITYTKDEGMEDGTYYLSMFNNNYKIAATRPNFDWSNYPGAGTYDEGEKSMYYKYLVNENNNTYELVESINLPYSSIVSSIQYVGDHTITSSGKSHVYAEYDENNKLIREYTYDAEKYAYRVFKYTYSNYWFYE